MIFNNLGVSLAFFLSLAALPADANSHHRRLVKPQQSIANEVKVGKANSDNKNNKNNKNNGPNKTGRGHGKPKFKLQGSKAGTSELFEVNVRESTPAITSATTYSVNGGPKRYVKADALDDILVADNEDDDETSAGTIALIAVNKKTGDVNGIVQRGRDKTKFTQKKNKQAWAFEAPEWEPPAWECGVSGAELESSHADEATSRHLNEDHRHHDHHHHDHDHFDLSDIKDNLRGSSVRLGKQRRALQGVGYSYQVDIYIEIDNQLCIDNGEDCTQGVIGPNTIGYVNALFAGANTIYEDEIDTHLGVAHIDVNNNYDSATGTSNALSTMRSIYANQGFGYAQGTPIDLHHALLSKNMGGGIAYVGVVCNSGYGFGLSASLNGNYQSMSASVVWDMNVFMHEIGHNFNTGHTHDYSPQIDTCGNTCPAGLPLAKSATIMSYCHLCSGSYSNVDYTFGGKYNGSGSRSDINNYQNSPLAGLGTISTEPRRVNVQMYNHVSSRSCATVPTGPPPPPPTPQPTPVATPNPTQAATPPPTPCPGTDLQVQIDLLVDNYPEETSWSLTNTCTGTVVQSFQGSTAVADGTQLSDSYCVPTGAYEFTINDAYGDGICCGYGLGNYEIFLNGASVVSATGEFAQSETTTFGPACPSSPTNPPTPAPTANPTPAPTPNPTPAPSSNPTPGPTANPTPNPTPGPSANPTPGPSANPTPGPTNQPVTTPGPTANPTPGPTNQPVTANPTPGPTSQPVTTDAPTPLPTHAPSTTPPTPCVEITIEIQTDMYPDQTAWSLADACTGETIVNSPKISVPGATYSNTYCLPPTEFKFMITDSLGDGLDTGSYQVLAGGNVVASGGQFGGSESTNFGSCAP